MNLPNMLTLSRLVLAFVLMLFLSVTFPLAKSLALLVFIVAGITDYFDGYLARTTYGVTSFGRLMDPLTDKVIVCAAFISFVDLHVVPAWIAVVVVAREFLVTGLRLLGASKGKIIPAGRWGKHKTVWQIVAIAALLLGLAVREDVLRHVASASLESFDFGFQIIAHVISAAVGLITVVTGLAYFLEHRELIRLHME
ncbi:MAG: CDP-diacylglycerol--glycerol-3-phosphate 3-phosphatidyltransferase [Kiritimatiellae bacterium]|nr:CDP-diacylglycerol--glycerol-3-phosphate 3-phosphatidyltransferase [Kiritimatiellia bacterium]